MGKHKKKKRNHSDSSGHHSKSRSRSRERPKRKSSDQQSNNFKPSPKNHQNLSLITHRYYLCNESKSIGIPYAVWNLCIKYSPRPQSILIICESMIQIAAICQANKLNRSLKIIDENDTSIDLNYLVRRQKIEVVLITQKKCSILLALEEYRKLFYFVLSVSKCFDTEFYLKIIEVSIEKGQITIFTDAISPIKKLSQSLGIQFQQTQGQISKFQINRQILSDIQFSSKPSNEILSQLSSLPFSIEQVAGRLFELELLRRQPPKSIHLFMPGYTTYKLDMDVQFNSLKYVWNFLREEFPKNLYESVKGMQKYQNEKGVVFNIPSELKYLTDVVSQKLRKYRAKFKGIQLSLCTKIPTLQNLDSEEYKELKQKKKLAMQQKNQLQIFIGGIPYEMDENSLKIFFKENNINLFLVRILKDEKGFSKGIGFGLCENKEHFERAIRLNGSRLIDRNIRVKLADQRKD